MRTAATASLSSHARRLTMTTLGSDPGTSCSPVSKERRPATTIGQAVGRAAQAEPSVFAGLRRRHPSLAPQELRKATLLALTRAIEDECCARAEQAALFAGFQHERFYAHSQERWKELARTARVVVVFASFSRTPALDAAPLKVHLPADAPMRREWTLVCEARDYPAFVTGWEFPGQEGTADADRRFEVLWSVDPQVVRDAAMICASLARSLCPALAPSWAIFRPTRRRPHPPICIGPSACSTG